MSGVTISKQDMSNPAKFIPHRHLLFRVGYMAEGDWFGGIPTALPLFGHVDIPADGPFHFMFGEQELLSPPIVLSSCAEPI